MKRTIILLAGVAILVAACNVNQQAQRVDAIQTDRQLAQYQAVQPVPFFNWSQDRQTLIQIYEAKNQARQTWSVFFSATGVPQAMCPSIGYPIPANTQLTSPDMIAIGAAGAALGTVSQMEPNGVYSTTGANGTYVLCARPSGKVAAVYSESWVTAFPYEVKLEAGQVVDLGGESSIEIDVEQPAGIPAAPSTAP